MSQTPSTGYDQARLVEDRGKRRLAPWLTSVAFEGRWVWHAKSQLAVLLQRQCGDAQLSVSEFESLVLELKFLDQSHEAPFEVYSNLVELPDGSVDNRQSTKGWGWTCQADLICIYNISRDEGVIGRLPAWRNMLNEKLPSGLKRGHLYQLRRQGKYRQQNASWILWTPYCDLVRYAGFIRFSAQQLELLDAGNPILRAAE